MKVKIPIGTRKLFGFGPKIKKYQTFYKKGDGFFDISFSPKDYDADSPQQAARMAYEDAKQHRDFYRALIRKGVYPTGTKANVQRLRHSNKYAVTLLMPEVNDYYFEDSQKLHGEKNDEFQSIIKIIDDESKKRGYQGNLHPDVGRTINYGEERTTKQLRFVDFHVLNEKLPFVRRKGLNGISIETQRAKGKTLEGKVGIASVVFFCTAIVFLSSNITGNVIGSLNQTSSNWIGIILFVIGLLSAFTYFRKDKKKNNRNQSAPHKNRK